MKKLQITISILLLVFTFACKKKGNQNTTANDPYNNTTTSPDNTLSQEQIKKILEKVKNTPIKPVKPNEFGFIKTNYGLIKIKFYPDKAPNTCANFKRLANAGFYNGTTFHRVIKGFVIQGGDILSRDSNRMNDGSGEIGYTIDAEISDLVHKRGSVAMARRGDDLNSASSQFYICLKRLPNLDGMYTVFADVVSGMDVVDRIAEVRKDRRDNPYERVTVLKAWVGTE